MKNPNSPRTLVLAGALLLAAVVAGFGGLAFFRKVDTFQPLGFRAAGADGDWIVVEVADPATGLRVGDRVVLVDRERARDETALRADLRRQPEATLTVVRAQRLEEVRYQRPPLDLDFPYLIQALVAAAYLLVGFYTLLRDTRRQALLFFLWCLASAAVYLLTQTSLRDPTGRAIFLFEEVARLLLPPLTLHLFLVFPSRLAASSWSRRLVPFVYLPAAALMALQADLAFFNGRFAFGQPTPAAIQTLDRLEIYLLVSYVALALLVLVRRLLANRDWEEHRQLQWIALGLGGGYLPFALLYVVPLALGLRRPELLAAVAVTPLALVPLSFAYAILRYKLWDIAVIVRDVSAYTLTLLLGIFGFSLVNLLISRGVPPQLALTRNLLSFAAGLGIAALLVPTKRTISSSLERLHYRGSFGKRRALTEFGQELLHERDLGNLCAALLKQLGDGLELERANLFLAQGEVLVPVRPEPSLPPNLARLPVDAFEPGFWRREIEVLSGVALPDAAPPLTQRLFVAGYRYAFPLHVRGTRVGLVVTGYKVDSTPLNSEDVELVRGLLNQAALAIENAQLVDQLARQLEETVRLQQHNEGIIESSPAGIAVLDGANRVTSANAAFAALAGVPREQLPGRPLAELLPVEPLPQPGGGLTEIAFCDRAGQERHLQVGVALFESGPQGGGGTMRVLVAQDISERVAMENALKESDRLAALGMLAAGVAHEVNTPITGISSYAQMLLADTPAEDPRYALLKKVERQTFRAARIVNSLLEFARHRQSEQRPLGLGALVDESVELLRERLSERHIALEWSRPAEEVTVLGNDGELQQVFTNLLLNAVDAMAEHGGTLRVALAADADKARVAVEDDGPGIPPALVEKVFQPFFSTKLAQGGTGLGLSISYNIVRKHGGELRVDNRPGQGCRFVVELPRAAP